MVGVSGVPAAEGQTGWCRVTSQGASKGTNGTAQRHAVAKWRQQQQQQSSRRAQLCRNNGGTLRQPSPRACNHGAHAAAGYADGGGGWHCSGAGGINAHSGLEPQRRCRGDGKQEGVGNISARLGAAIHHGAACIGVGLDAIGQAWHCQKAGDLGSRHGGVIGGTDDRDGWRGGCSNERAKEAGVTQPVDACTTCRAQGRQP